jgi:hypothetical protein
MFERAKTLYALDRAATVIDFLSLGIKKSEQFKMSLNRNEINKEGTILFLKQIGPRQQFILTYI